MYLEVSDVKKSYGEGGSYIQVLKGVSLQVKQGDMCVIQGTSGSGKSTLLNCIGVWIRSNPVRSRWMEPRLQV